MAELRDQYLERHAILDRHRGEHADRVHEAGDRAPLLGHLDEDLARCTVLVEPDVDVAFMSGDLELVAEGLAVDWEPPPDRIRLPRPPHEGRVGLGLPAGLRGVERLGFLAAVAVDGDRLQAEPPGFDVRLFDVLDRRLLGHVDRLRDRARDERLHRAHHTEVAEVVDGSYSAGRAERTVEDR